MANSAFTDKELQLIRDQEFLRTKIIILSKVQGLLEKTQMGLELVLKKSQFQQKREPGVNPMKISKGEKYRNLPYMVLDYPAYFSQNDIFAYRSMFWWGNFFSCTLHLQGISLSTYRSKILEHIAQLERDNYYLCIGESPWQYHYGADNYKQLTSKDFNAIENCSFLKLSKKIELDDWPTLPDFSASCLSNFLNILGMI